MRQKKSILLAIMRCSEADEIREQLAQSYSVEMAISAKAVANSLEQRHSHLVLISADLPGTGGLTLIRNLRRYYEVPIIFLLESADESAIVDALDAGANDVLILPFGRAEHLARIRAALRHGSSTPSIKVGQFSAGGLTINYASRIVCVGDKHVHLTPIEFRIMTLLTLNAGKVLTHDQIINEIWGPYNSDNLVLRVNMANIRRKIEPNPAEPRYVLTEVGVGYRAISE